MKTISLIYHYNTEQPPKLSTILWHLFPEKLLEKLFLKSCDPDLCGCRTQEVTKRNTKSRADILATLTMCVTLSLFLETGIL
jgi:hypothetical protein